MEKTNLLKRKGRLSYSSFERREFPFIYLLIAFPVLQFIVFWFYVNASSITLSFKSPEGAFTFDNIKTVVQAFTGTDPYGFNLSKALGRSFALWLVGHLICFPISIVTTYVLFKRVTGHYVFRICYIIPGLMGPIIWTSLVKFTMGYDGAVMELFRLLGIRMPENALRNGLLASEQTAFPSIVSVQFIMGLVGSNAVLTGAFSRVPDELFESAKLDGAGFWTQCFRIAVPCIWSTISTLLTFGLCSILTADANVFLYSNGTGEPAMATIGFELYYITYNISLTGAGTASYGYPAALGLVLTCLTVPLVLVGRWLIERVYQAVEV